MTRENIQELLQLLGFEHEGNIYRIFCCFDEGDLVVLFNGFQKKTQKTPNEQLDRAEALMKKYYERKNG